MHHHIVGKAGLMRDFGSTQVFFNVENRPQSLGEQSLHLRVAKPNTWLAVHQL
jgi:hypothetical protein